MKKFLGILILITAMQLAKSQCTAFLGPDKQYMPCSNPFALNTDSIFQNEPATTTFQQQQLPPFDTIFAVGGGIDTLIPLSTKVMYTATRADGCTDVCIVGVAIRMWPIPDLGPDTCLNLGFQQETMSINAKFINKITSISGYNNHTWSTPTPQNVDTGFYWVKVVTDDGCSDVLSICVMCAVIRDTLVKKCDDDKYNLTTLFVKSGYTNLWKRIRFPQGDTIVYPTPAAADTGRYLLFSSKPGRCTDTMFVKVENLPRLDLGADRNEKKCFGSTINLTQLFLLTGIQTNWSKNGVLVPDPTKAGPDPGTFRLIGTNLDGCKDTVFINVTDNPKPDLQGDKFEFICPTGNPINLNTNFILTGLDAQWNTPNPESVQNKGTYRLIATNEFGCKDTANFTIFHHERPSFLNDTTINLCFGKTKDLNTIYNIPPPYSLVDWSTATPATAGAGNYIITIQDNIQDCQYTAVVHIDVAPNNVEQLNVCLYNTTTTTGVFTTNSFRSITVDKRGQVWAGSNGGGLYRYTRLNSNCVGGGIWERNTPTTGISTITNTYRDLYPSNVFGDTSIWAASLGHSLPYNITGGVDHITTLNAPVQHFGSVNDPNPTGNGGLSSRSANSIAMSQSGKLYAALGMSAQATDTTDTSLQGGGFQYDLATAPTSFTQLPVASHPFGFTRVVSAVGVRKNNIWFAVERYCLNGCQNPYIVLWDENTNSSPGTITENTSPIPFDNQSLVVRAILTDSVGRTFLGLNLGNGIAVLDSAATDPTWTMLNSSNTPLPVGATINTNAITQVLDEIWIGTNMGLLVYNGIGGLTDCASWKLYTTANNLPSNNITDIAFDYNTFETWLTSDAGVCKLSLSPSITGTVMNVYAGKYDALRPQLGKKPLSGVVVSLIKSSDNSFVSSTTTTATGNFEFTNVQPFTEYTVRVRYFSPNFSYKYSYDYNKLKYNSVIGEILIPDSLRMELDTLKLKLAKRKFPFSQYGISFDLGSLVEADGYIIDSLMNPYKYYHDSVITKNFNNRVENIAIYYSTLATMYNIGIKRIELKTEQYAAFFDAVHSLLAFFDCNEFNSHVGIFGQPGLTHNFVSTGVKALAVTFKTGLNKLLESVDDPATKQSIKDYSEKINSAIDVLLNVGVNGFKGTFANELVNLFKKAMVVVGTNVSYKTFCQETHKDLIKKLSDQTIQTFTLGKYASNYNPIFNLDTLPPPSEQSLNRQASDINADALSQIGTLKNLAGIADATAGFLGAVEKIAEVATVITLGAAAPVAAFFKGAGVAAKTANSAFLFSSALVGLVGSERVEEFSNYLIPESGFYTSANQPTATPDMALSANANLDSLRARKTRYNNKLNELNTLYNAPFDSAAYFNKLREFTIIDSLYTDENERVTNLIIPKINFGIKNVTNYQSRLNMALDTFYNKQQHHKSSFVLSNLAYMLDFNNASIKQDLTTTIAQLKVINDSSVNAIEQVIDMGAVIPTTAYLVQDKFVKIFSNQTNSNGSLTYTFKNIGNVAQNNVNFNMLQLDGGFTLTSTAYINVGNILPGQSKTITYQFASPATDTMGNYTIVVNADNGSYKNVSGVLYTELPIEVTSIANGLWSNPETWSTGRVPTGSSKVTILHNVDVDITTAECESIKAIAPGLLKVKAGMKLSVLK